MILNRMTVSIWISNWIFKNFVVLLRHSVLLNNTFLGSTIIIEPKKLINAYSTGFFNSALFLPTNSTMADPDESLELFKKFIKDCREGDTESLQTNLDVYKGLDKSQSYDVPCHLCVCDMVDHVTFANRVQYFPIEVLKFLLEHEFLDCDMTLGDGSPYIVYNLNRRQSHGSVLMSILDGMVHGHSYVHANHEGRQRPYEPEIHRYDGYEEDKKKERDYFVGALTLIDYIAEHKIELLHNTRYRSCGVEDGQLVVYTEWPLLDRVMTSSMCEEATKMIYDKLVGHGVDPMVPLIDYSYDDAGVQTTELESLFTRCGRHIHNDVKDDLFSRMTEDEQTAEINRVDKHGHSALFSTFEFLMIHVYELMKNSNQGSPDWFPYWTHRDLNNILWFVRNGIDMTTTGYKGMNLGDYMHHFKTICGDRYPVEESEFYRTVNIEPAHDHEEIAHMWIPTVKEIVDAADRDNDMRFDNIVIRNFDPLSTDDDNWTIFSYLPQIQSSFTVGTLLDAIDLTDNDISTELYKAVLVLVGEKDFYHCPNSDYETDPEDEDSDVRILCRSEGCEHYEYFPHGHRYEIIMNIIYRLKKVDALTQSRVEELNEAIDANDKLHSSTRAVFKYTYGNHCLEPQEWE
jgi:hypothetical protein